MTTLDRAFIKAYDETHPREIARPHRAPRAAVPQVAATSGRVIERLAPEPTRSSTHAANALAPLSSFVAPPKIEDSFRPLLEVDSLAWPEVCTSLLAHGRSAWERFAEQLAERIVDDNKTLALMSCRRGEGRTTIALATGRLMAERGLRCVIVDCDFDNPSLAKRCGVSPQLGWGEVVDGGLPFGESLVAAVENQVSIMPWRGSAAGLSQHPAIGRATAGFQQLREHFDLVILDAIALGASSAEKQLPVLASIVGPCSVHLVCDPRNTTPVELAGGVARLRRASIKVAGIIENFSPV
jgi:Mrp family chromosome partitioning ATPase